MTHVVLHIGAFKTGTSFIQQVLSQDKEAMADHGVLFPGRTWSDQVSAVHDLKGRPAGEPGDWDRLVDEIDQWQGTTAVISMEFLSTSKPQVARKALESLQQHDVTLLLTARDLVRTIPAQWQESVQNGLSWSYRSYLKGVTGRQRPTNRAGHHFWRRQDFAAILRYWGDTLPRDRVVLITVPPPGAPRTVLWQRFCTVLGVPPDAFDTSTGTNESLGATSTEVMRRVTDHANELGFSAREWGVLKKVLAKSVLAAHKSAEPTVVLPPELFEWATKRSRRLVEELRTVGPTVIGDLDELTPAPPRTGPDTTTDPGLLPTDHVLDAAVVGITGLAQVIARQRGPSGATTDVRRKRRRAGRAGRAGPPPGEPAGGDATGSEDPEEPSR